MDHTFDLMAKALQEEGLVAAVHILNAGVKHRFTAVYEHQGSVLVNRAMVDKQGEPVPNYLVEVPYSLSFCQYAIRDGHFATGDSRADPRLDGHPYQGVMAAYHAVPLVSSAGRIQGTICHFDTEARTLEDEDFEVLRLAARVVPAYLGPRALRSPLVR